MTNLLESGFFFARLVAFLVAWACSFVIVLLVFRGSEGSSAYALVAAWCLSFYYSRVLGLNVWYAVGVVVSYLCVSALSLAVTGRHFFVHDFSLSTLPEVLWSLFTGVFLAVPIIADAVLSRYLRNNCRVMSARR